jgi:hypothetical protein
MCFMTFVFFYVYTVNYFFYIALIISGGHIRILPRLPSRVTALAYVHGLSTHLLCTSADGTIYVADFLRPEDSYTAGVKLPNAAAQVYFVSGDSFALCMCPGGTAYGSEVAPCVMWYDMVSACTPQHKAMTHVLT